MSEQSPQYTRNELKVLWHLKRNGGWIAKPDAKPGYPSLLDDLVGLLDIRVATLRYTLRNLEQRCVILRTYRKANAVRFAESKGYNPIIKIELCDPGMWLPNLPAPLPLAAVVAHENEELHERTAHEPSNESIILALLERNEELRKQLDRLHEIIIGQEQEVETLKKQVARVTAPRGRPEHLTHRLKDALTVEKWDELEH